MGLAPEIAAVLSDKAAERDPLAGVYHLARAYEVADWQRVEEIAAELGVPVANLGEVYCAATGWAAEVMEPVSATQPV